MKIEDIENAAREESGRWASTPIHLQDIYRRDDFEAGFLTGAEWRIDSVWHNITEKPNFLNLPILLQHKDGKIHFIDAVPASWIYFQKYYTGWAYIEDLLPTKE